MERETKGERHSKNVCLRQKRRKRLDSGKSFWPRSRLVLDCRTVHALTASFSEPWGTLVSCLLIYYFYLYLITTSSVPGTAHCRFRSEENRQVSLLDGGYSLVD